MRSKILKIVYSGLTAGLVSEGILGFFFTSSFIRSILYDPKLQSPQFLEVTANRVIPLPITIAGLVVLSVVHAWLFRVLRYSIPGNSWIKKGVFWGFCIWLMYWLFQEWFIFYTLLGEPPLLVMLELTLLLIGSLIEGLIISKFLYEEQKMTPKP